MPKGRHILRGLLFPIFQSTNVKLHNGFSRIKKATVSKR
jgi:hypothetical protein